MYWLFHELSLTLREIQGEITIPHTITGMIGYGILHASYAMLHHEERTLVRRLKNDQHKVAWLHVKKRHCGRFSHCNDCVIIQRHRLPEAQL